MSMRLRLFFALLSIGALIAPKATAQTVLQRPAQTLSLPRGTSLLLVNPGQVQRFTVGDPAIADVLVVSPTEVIINGRGLGSTTLIIWEQGGAPKLYSLEVTIDTPALERYIRETLPGERITVSASGNSVTLSGTTNDPIAADRAVEWNNPFKGMISLASRKPRRGCPGPRGLGEGLAAALGPGSTARCAVLRPG